MGNVRIGYDRLDFLSVADMMGGMNSAKQVRLIADTSRGGGDEISTTQMDLEAWRVREGLTYDALAPLIGVTVASQARRYALGARWPDPDVMERIEAVTAGAVSVLAMHRKRTEWLRSQPSKHVKVTIV